MISVERRPNAPPSLSRCTSYRDNDVLDALHEDFLGKCYLCENALPHRVFEVDHLIPQHKAQALIHDWSNLFPACAHCNNRRDKKTRPGGYLDPCTHDMDARLKQTFERSRKIGTFSARVYSDATAKNTADQLNHLHSEKSPKGMELANAIRKNAIDVLLAAHTYDLSKNEQPETDLHEAEVHLRDLLSRKALFTALMRSLVPDLHPFFD